MGLFALAVREAGGQEVEELARDGPATAVTGGARERLHGRPPSWLEPLLGGSASTRDVQHRGWRGACPFDPQQRPSLTLGVRGPRSAPSAFRPAARHRPGVNATAHQAARPESLDLAERDPVARGGSLCPAKPSADSHRGVGDGGSGGGPPPSTAPPVARKPLGSKGGGAAPCQSATFNVASAGLDTL